LEVGGVMIFMISDVEMLVKWTAFKVALRQNTEIAK
jgi:hypothetical protein